MLETMETAFDRFDNLCQRNIPQCTLLITGIILCHSFIKPASNHLTCEVKTKQYPGL